MTLIVKENAKPREPVPLGTQQAVCCYVVQGPEEKDMNGFDQPKVIIGWELAELMSDKRPFMISRKFTLSLGKKANLRKFLDSWRGVAFTQEELQGFDLEKLIGVNCLLNLAEGVSKTTGKVYVNVLSAMPLVKGMAKIAPQMEKLPEWIEKWCEEGRVQAAEKERAREKLHADAAIARGEMPVQTPYAPVGAAAQAGQAEVDDPNSPPF